MVSVAVVPARPTGAGRDAGKLAADWLGRSVPVRLRDLWFRTETGSARFVPEPLMPTA